MFLDDSLTFSDNQGPITASVASSTSIPLGPTTIQGASTFLGIGAQGGLNASSPSRGEPVHVFGRVTQAFNNLTSLDVDIQACDDAAGTGAVSLLKKTIPLAALTLNAPIPLGALASIPVGKKYLRAYYTVTGSAPTAGRISCGLVPFENGKPQVDAFSY